MPQDRKYANYKPCLPAGVRMETPIREDLPTFGHSYLLGVGFCLVNHLSKKSIHQLADAQCF
jgi:hypothetical protein